MTLNTPSGIPASIANSATLNADSGDCSAGFRIKLFPVASAGANFQQAISNGKFHGVTAPTTPSGSLVMVAIILSLVGATSSYNLSIASAYHLVQFIHAAISPVALVIGLPIFKVSNSPSSKMFFFIRSAKLKSIFFLLEGAILDHEPFSKTALAAFTALLISSTSHSDTFAINEPSTGLMLSKVLPVTELV